MSDPAGGVPGMPPPVAAGASAAAGGVPWTAGGAISFGWEKVKANPGIVGALFVGGLVASFVGMLGNIISSISQASGDRDSAQLGAFLAYGLMVVNIPISCWIEMGMIRYALRVARGERPELSVIFSGGPFLNFLGATILVGLATAVGFVLCIVPGVFLLIAWCFWKYLVVDREADVIESMRRSWKLTEGRRMDLFGFLILLFLLNLLGLILCIVGLIVTSAITALAFAWTYDRFVAMNPQAAERLDD